MIDLDSIHLFLRYSHIATGAIGLVLFWVPVFAAKGGRLHTVSGKLFAVVAYVVAGTAAISSIWGLAFPISFTGITRELSAQEIETLSARVRFLFAILGTLMTWVVAGVQVGTYAMRTNGVHDKSLSRVRAFVGLSSVASLVLVMFGVSQLMASGGPNYFLHVGLGIFGWFDSRKTLAFLRKASPGQEWVIIHIESMLGTGIAFYTAFFVFGFSRFSGLKLPGAWAMVPWLIPTAVGVVATNLLVRRYRSNKIQTSNEEVSD